MDRTCSHPDTQVSEATTSRNRSVTTPAWRLETALLPYEHQFDPYALVVAQWLAAQSRRPQPDWAMPGHVDTRDAGRILGMTPQRVAKALRCLDHRGVITLTHIDFGEATVEFHHDVWNAPDPMPAPAPLEPFTGNEF